MSRVFQMTSISTEWSEPLWPYDLDDSYLQLDLGESEEGLHADVKAFKKPWFKQNYRHTTPKNLRFYKRPFFQVETPE
ncbi:MAG: hypothetical protein V4598_09280 [Bdellovibrionota bacterium]